MRAVVYKMDDEKKHQVMLRYREITGVGMSDMSNKAIYDTLLSDWRFDAEQQQWLDNASANELATYLWVYCSPREIDA